MRERPCARPRRSDTGDSATSYLAAVVLVASVAGLVVTSGVDDLIARGTSTAVCKVVQGDCAAAPPAPSGTNAGSIASPAPSQQTTQHGPATAASQTPAAPAGGDERRPTPGTSLKVQKAEVPTRPSDDTSPPAAAGAAGPTPQPSPPWQILQSLQGFDPGPAAPPRHDGGAGPFNSEVPQFDDHVTDEKFRNAASAATFTGRKQTGANMRHYLDGTGKPLKVDPREMLADLPNFKRAVDEHLATFDCRLYPKLIAALDKNGGRPVSLPFRGSWKSFYAKSTESEDWYFAMGGFRYQVSGYLTAQPSVPPGGPPKVTMNHRLHVYDRYNWDTGKSVYLPVLGFVPDTDLQRLHRTGLAQEYDLQGSSGPLSRTVSPVCTNAATNGPTGVEGSQR